MEKREAETICQALSISAEVLDSNFYEDETRWNAEATLTYLLIHMNEALQKLSKTGMRVDFKDDVHEGDVTNLINLMRNALCHFGSPTRHLGPNGYAAFNVAIGKAEFFRTLQMQLTSDYDDDVAFNYGRYRIYLYRHIGRAFEEADVKLRALFERSGWII